MADFCPHCAHAKEALEIAVADLGPERFELRVLDVVQEIDHAVALGVLATPAIAIDGKLAAPVSPTAHKLKAFLETCLHSKAEESSGAISNR
jgi:protein-disulfide isomerase